MQPTSLSQYLAKLSGLQGPYSKHYRFSVVFSLMLLLFSWLMTVAYLRVTVDSSSTFFHHVIVSLAIFQALGLAFILHGYGAVRREQARHELIIGACRDLTEGIYHRRLSLEKYPEMQELESAFNGMVEAIWQRTNRVTPGGAA